MARTIVLENGVRLEYVERGDSNGLPVIFLHGVTDSWGAFEVVLAELPETVHAFALSQRGHGNSSRPGSGYRMTDFSEDLRLFMDALEIPAATVVGHSMGSFVAQRFAIDHPRRTLGLVLMGSAPGMRQNPTIVEFSELAVENLRDPIEHAFAWDFQRSTIAKPVDQAFFDACVLESLKVPARIWRETFAGFLDLDHATELGRIYAPTLVAWGDQDFFFAREEQMRLHEGIAGSELRIYAGGGHAFHWEDPATFAEDLIGFLRVGALAR